MTAHTRALRHSGHGPCDHAGCAAGAACEVVSALDAPLGDFCRHHGRRRLLRELHRDAAYSALSAGDVREYVRRGLCQ